MGKNKYYIERDGELDKLMDSYITSSSPDISVLDKARTEMQMKARTDKKRSCKLSFRVAAMSAMVFILTVTAAVLFATLPKNNGDGDNRYSDFDNLTSETVDSIADLNAAYGKAYLYLDDAEAAYSVNTVYKDEEEIVYAKSEYTISAENVTLSAYDTAEAAEQLLKMPYLDQTIVIDETEIIYSEIENRGIYTTSAKFEYNGVIYGLTIKANAPDKLQYYIALLLS